MTDPIADMLTRIRNANQNRSASCEIPASNMKEEIAKILKNEGYIEDYKIEGETANTNEEAFDLLKELGVPFRK